MLNVSISSFFSAAKFLHRREDGASEPEGDGAATGGVGDGAQGMRARSGEGWRPVWHVQPSGSARRRLQVLPGPDGAGAGRQRCAGADGGAKSGGVREPGMAQRPAACWT